MPSPTLIELTNNINQVQKAMKELQSVQTSVTSNPAIDKSIGKAYKELSKALAGLNVEAGLL
jgi:hypothetical protein